MKFVYCDRKYSSGSSAPLRETYFWGQLCKHTLSGVLSQLPRSENEFYALFGPPSSDAAICRSFSFRQLAADKRFAKESNTSRNQNVP